MLELPTIYKPKVFVDDALLQSLDWIESFPWSEENTVRTDRDKYEICLQVKQYGPKEISVKVVDGCIVVEEGCFMDKINSRLSSDGLLFITVPRKPVVKNDTVIPVKHESSKSKSKL
ncbi:unnamed protein product [Arctia plantaginis]|uniref:Uncharacterized protein n=1 Tax=Arctia plantaginis TaxID=874455 RepID=A0A8S0ZJH6_ARCPL|nr:unnamed protein product [Arctia plantaginis]CAB3242713.1 unnamed protein product [Arctia plantaginis]